MESKKTKIISIVAIVALLLVVITTTYAYFNASIGDPAAADVKINANTVDTLTFSSGNEITLNLDQENFASGKGNQSGSTYASAMLTANNKTNTATEHYYLYLNISDNTFTYSINENTPEIIMTVTDNTGAEVTDISTLNHVIVTGADGTQVSGYDITYKSGLITLFNNREITANPSKEEKWNIKVTFVNYDENQNANAGKSMSAKVMIQRKKIIAYISDMCSSNDNLANCLTTLGNIENLKFTNLYHHDSTLTNGAGDNSYRYAGASNVVNNFMCFGSAESPCPTDNLYRIIGVFGEQVKLIKYDYANSNLLGTDGDYYTSTFSKSSYSTYKGELTEINKYYWNYKANNSNSNTWSTSLFNKTNLNTNFLNNIGPTWSNLIEDTTWKVGGNKTCNVTPSAMYTAEITNATKIYGPSDGTSKIGLMYASDYGFAASPSAWTANLSSYSNSSIISVNWMYMGLNEWTLTPYSLNSYYVFDLSKDGSFGGNSSAGNGRGVRPVLYLKASVAYAGGSGTKDAPITLVV